MDIDPIGDYAVSEVAAHLGMKHLEVTRRINRGDIVAHKVGWFWVVKGQAILDAKRTPWYRKRLKKNAA